MTRLPKKFDEFTMLKQFTMKFTGLTIEKKKEWLKTALSSLWVLKVTVLIVEGEKQTVL